MYKLYKNDIKICEIKRASDFEALTALKKFVINLWQKERRTIEELTDDIIADTNKKIQGVK